MNHPHRNLQTIKRTMNRFVFSFVAVAGFATSMFVTPSSLSAQDRLVQEKGATLSGIITKLDRDNVTIEVRGEPQNIPVNEINRIQFEDEPTIMGRARDLTRQGQFEQARDELKKVDAATIKNDNAKRDLAFYLAYCDGRLALQGKGDKAAAVKALVAYDKDNPNSYHYWEVSQLLGQLAGSMARYDAAQNFYKRLNESAFAEVKNQGKYQEALTLLIQNKPAEAKPLFTELQGISATNPKEVRIKQLAEVALAQCKLAEGDAQGALTSVNEWIAKGDSTDIELFGKLYNLQGACYQKLGKTSEAILAYLHTDLLFAGDAENHAEALYHLSVLLPSLNYTQQATDARARLTTTYAGSVWATKQ
ncbi:MAG: hypothetical protein JNK90_08505 [Planctomycetaceae bacterium]|nr:hypothetical protein [Planctomycetaceae bacterium]